MRPRTNVHFRRAHIAVGILATSLLIANTQTSWASQAPAFPSQPSAIGAVGIPNPAAEILRTIHSKLKVRHARLNVLAGHVANIAGVLTPRLPKRVVDLQASKGHHWRTIAHVHTSQAGRFVLRYRATHMVSERLRIRFPGDGLDTQAIERIGQLTVYRLAGASWYGGGGSLACGGSLTSATIGVANKTLPCGTLVRLRYHGRSVRVPVIDRGPYVAGRDYDLTEATKRKLGFGDLGQVWSSR